MNRNRLFSFPEQRVLEDAAFARDVLPTQIFALLLPVWSVTIQADITEAEDYELIDRFLARGIAEGGLTTTAELADFYALEPELVDRALRALAAIGHVADDSGRWALTGLGLRSVRDRKRYIVTRGDRRKLYFTAFGSKPLTRPYYDTRKVTLVTAEEVPGIRSADGPRFHELMTTRGLDGNALDALAANPQRDRFNMPDRVEGLRRLGSDELVYLPVYVVRGRTPQGRQRYLAYGQVSAEADPDLSDLVDRTPEVVTVLEAELTTARRESDLERVRAWLRKQNLGKQHVARVSSDELLRVRLSPDRFGGDGLSLNRVGSFVVQANSLFQLWCDDVAVRRLALLSRIDTTLAAYSKVDRTVVVDRIARIARQLDLGEISLAELRDAAVANKRTALAAQLNGFL
ncbi:hypothetical protein [Actinophytocola algeriensis]|uniref:Uncharacterized protein n=1 Tax=Actinophytocola algeriensis TaxID=1768010 RepID=A0A7W7Q8S0_9PSEU|nr:hypothetical protein [Actinophytocola algeriensis]MBB4909170.1 hypothetical protein [Actinophytocola algeriensis]MBE1474442.1 hypothetical protein [Actinophytocola algeriensis]